jgi:hypothetical protein
MIKRMRISENGLPGLITESCGKYPDSHFGKALEIETITGDAGY